MIRRKEGRKECQLGSTRSVRADTSLSACLPGNPIAAHLCTLCALHLHFMAAPGLKCCCWPAQRQNTLLCLLSIAAYYHISAILATFFSFRHNSSLCSFVLFINSTLIPVGYFEAAAVCPLQLNATVSLQQHLGSSLPLFNLPFN